MATLANSSNDADKNTLVLLEKQKAIEEYLASQKAKEESSKEEKSNDQE